MRKHSKEYKLFEKYINQTLTEAELSELRLFFQREEERADRLLATYFESDMEAFGPLHKRAETVERRAWNSIQKRMDQSASPAVSLSWILKFAAAASILIILSLCIYFLPQFNSDHQIALKDDSENIKPGSNRATLVTSKGTVFQLSGLNNEIIVDEQAIRYKDGAVLEDDQSNQNLTLSTPKGGQYRVVLSDGTRVWLNAASSISYPAIFTGNERIVKISGEAYFEVFHDASHPFIVRSEGQDVKVLGTSFNINAYADEHKTVTTLLSGKIQLSSAAKGISQPLAPGEQASLENASIALKKVDADLFVAWKEGEFRFNSTPLLEALRQISRWYDLDIDYTGIPTDVQIHASINRNNKLSTVLHALEKITDLKFNVKGRSLKLMP